jgi:hypothetical protein
MTRKKISVTVVAQAYQKDDCNFLTTVMDGNHREWNVRFPHSIQAGEIVKVVVYE